LRSSRVFTCRTCSTVGFELKIIDVPVCSTDLLFDIIEGAVCLHVFFGVHAVNNVAREFLDVLYVIG
jgi:hypothetical protein